MEYAGALLVAAVAGFLVYRLSLGRTTEELPPPESRGDAAVEEWAGIPAHAAEAAHAEEADRARALPEPGTGSQHIPLRTRLLGLVGLLALVAVSAAALAWAIWQVAHLLNQEAQKYLHP